MIYFTADWHLGHKNIIKYCNRPFKSVEEMDNVILECFKDKVKKGDTLYFLGDLTFDQNIFADFLRHCHEHNIRLIFIKGNHDKIPYELMSIFNITIKELVDINIHTQPITLCHYAMRRWNKSHYGAWQLYGHSHGMLPPVGKQWDVGVDNNKFLPVSFDEIKAIMATRPDNSDLIIK